MTTEPVSPVTSPAAGIDPDAPYGRKADGSPKRKPGPSKGTARGGARRAAAPTANRQKVSQSKEVMVVEDYTGPIHVLAQVPAMVLDTLGKLMKSDPLRADGSAITLHSLTVAAGCNQAIMLSPKVRASVDRFFESGVGANAVLAIGLVNAFLPLAVQIRANHSDGKLTGPGILPVQTLIEQAPSPMAVLAQYGISETSSEDAAETASSSVNADVTATT